MLTIHTQGAKDGVYQAYVFLESQSNAIHSTEWKKTKGLAIRAAKSWIAKLQKAVPRVDES